jgi:hypothetical protein
VKKRAMPPSIPIAIIAALAVSAYAASAQAPPGPFPAQDTPPLTASQRCETQLDASAKPETSGRGPSRERSPISEEKCPPADPDRSVVPQPPPAGSPDPRSQTPDAPPP